MGCNNALWWQDLIWGSFYPNETGRKGKTMARRAQLDCQVGLEVRQLGFAGSRYIYSCDGLSTTMNLINIQYIFIKYPLNIDQIHVYSWKFHKMTIKPLRIVS